MEDGFKQCKKCCEVKPLGEFSRDKSTKDGHKTHCKECIKQYRQENREQILERGKQYRQENRERIVEYGKQYCQENRERLIRYRQENRERIAEYRKQYRQKNPEYLKRYKQENRKLISVYYQNRRARKRSLPHTLTPSDWQAALGYFNHTCAVCGRQRGMWHTLAMDHWIPLVSPDCPGTIPENIVPLCHGVDGCNNSKNDKHPEVWLKEQFGDKKAKKILQRIQAYFEQVKKETL